MKNGSRYFAESDPTVCFNAMMMLSRDGIEDRMVSAARLSFTRVRLSIARVILSLRMESRTGLTGRGRGRGGGVIAVGVCTRGSGGVGGTVSCAWVETEISSASINARFFNYTKIAEEQTLLQSKIYVLLFECGNGLLKNRGPLKLIHMSVIDSSAIRSHT